MSAAEDRAGIIAPFPASPPTSRLMSNAVPDLRTHLTELLRAIAEDPSKAIGQLNLMPAAERHQVLVERNQTQREYPPDKCLHQLFEEQAERTPEAVALGFEGQQLTYRELNERANRLINALRGLGLTAGDVIAVYAGNSIAYFELMVAATHAGIIFVPVNWHFTAQ